VLLPEKAIPLVDPRPVLENQTVLAQNHKVWDNRL